MEEIRLTTAHPEDLLGGRRLDGMPRPQGELVDPGHSRSIPAAVGSITSHGGRVKLEHAGGERPFQIGPSVVNIYARF
jgi:hypothetical protein